MMSALSYFLGLKELKLGAPDTLKALFSVGFSVVVVVVEKAGIKPSRSSGAGLMVCMALVLQPLCNEILELLSRRFSHGVHLKGSICLLNLRILAE